MKDEWMRVDPDFKKYVDEVATGMEKSAGIFDPANRKRKIGSRIVTKKLLEKLKKKEGFIL